MPLPAASCLNVAESGLQFKDCLLLPFLDLEALTFRWRMTQDSLLLSALPSRRNPFHHVYRLAPTFFGGDFLTGGMLEGVCPGAQRDVGGGTQMELQGDLPQNHACRSKTLCRSVFVVLTVTALGQTKVLLWCTTSPTGHLHLLHPEESTGRCGCCRGGLGCSWFPFPWEETEAKQPLAVSGGSNRREGSCGGIAERNLPGWKMAEYSLLHPEDKEYLICLFWG